MSRPNLDQTMSHVNLENNNNNNSDNDPISYPPRSSSISPRPSTAMPHATHPGSSGSLARSANVQNYSRPATYDPKSRHHPSRSHPSSDTSAVMIQNGLAAHINTAHPHRHPLSHQRVDGTRDLHGAPRSRSAKFPSDYSPQSYFRLDSRSAAVIRTSPTEENSPASFRRSDRRSHSSGDISSPSSRGNQCHDTSRANQQNGNRPVVKSNSLNTPADTDPQPRTHTLSESVLSHESKAQRVDAALEDQDEFCLFAQATTGLGPDSLFATDSVTPPSLLTPAAPTSLHTSAAIIESRKHTTDLHSTHRPHSSHSKPSAQSEQQFPPYTLPRRPRSPSSFESSRMPTPNLVSIPGRTHPYALSSSMMNSDPRNHADHAHQSSRGDPSGSAPQHDRNGTDQNEHNGLDGQNPSRHISSQSYLESILDPYADERPPDDELPDYAASQAQAQASQRLEATRRARELQKQWLQSAYRPRYG